MKQTCKLPPAGRSRRPTGNKAKEANSGDSASCNLPPPLLLKTSEVCRMLGNINSRTLSRLESRDLIFPVQGLLRHKLYRYSDVVALVENLSPWKP